MSKVENPYQFKIGYDLINALFKRSLKEKQIYAFKKWIGD